MSNETLTVKLTAKSARELKKACAFLGKGFTPEKIVNEWASDYQAEAIACFIVDNTAVEDDQVAALALLAGEELGRQIPTTKKSPSRLRGLLARVSGKAVKA